VITFNGGGKEEEEESCDLFIKLEHHVRASELKISCPAIQ
jgi:hypothetical protein